MLTIFILYDNPIYTVQRYISINLYNINYSYQLIIL